MPYSCQLQFGTSGSCVSPVGGAEHLARHRLADIPDFEIDDGPEDDARAAGKLERRAIDDRRIVAALARQHGFRRADFPFLRHTLNHRFPVRRQALVKMRARPYVGFRTSDNLSAVFRRAWLCDHKRVRWLRFALQFAADRSSMEPTCRGLIIFPAFEILTLIPSFDGLSSCHNRPLPRAFGPLTPPIPARAMTPSNPDAQLAKPLATRDKTGSKPSARCAPRPNAARRSCRLRIKSFNRCPTPARPSGIGRM